MPPEETRRGRLSRRDFCAAMASSAFALSGCLSGPGEPHPERARLTARHAPPTGTIQPGFRALWTGTPAAFIIVPDSYDPGRPLPLVVALHGAGGSAQGPINLLGAYAQSSEFILLVPESAGQTWDVILDDYGPDIATLDRALRRTFELCAVDPARITLEGFSDGASYALGVGITNPEVFRRVTAFSPGFVSPALARTARPSIFISHGTADPILPIDDTSRRIVPELEGSGFTVTYMEFPGGHEVPPGVVQSAVTFMVS